MLPSINTGTKKSLQGRTSQHQILPEVRGKATQGSTYGERLRYKVFATEHEQERTEKNRIINNALRNLPTEKQYDLLRSLSKLESDLETNSVDKFDGGNDNESYSSLRTHRKELDNLSNVSLSSSLAPSRITLGTFGSSSTNGLTREMRRLLIEIGREVEATKADVESVARGQCELLGPTALREYLHMQLRLETTPKQVENLINIITCGSSDRIHYGDLLGYARTYYDKYKRKLKTERVGRELAAKRKKLDEDLNLSKCRSLEKVQMKEQEIQDVLEVIREASYQLLVAKEVKRIRASRSLVMSSKAFHDTLREFGVTLGPREEKLLEERYHSEDPRGVDFSRFKDEFLKLGGEVFVERRKEDAMREFMRRLAIEHGNQGRFDDSLEGSAAARNDQPWSYTGNTGDVILTEDYIGAIREAANESSSLQVRHRNHYLSSQSRRK